MTPNSDQAESPPSLVTLWIGNKLGPVETACLASAMRQGHHVALYCYRVVTGVPRGVEVRDAAAILPKQAVVRHHMGSPALFADRFRYELLRLGLGTWIDCDAYFLRPLDGTAPMLFGWQDGSLINNGVLRLPADSPVLPPLLAFFEERTVPAWLPLRARLAARWRLAMCGRTGIRWMPWGSSGPAALTWLLRRHGLDRNALLPEVLYPVPWQRAGWILDPAIVVGEMVTQRTVSLHVWTSQLPAALLAAPPSGSFLARLAAEAEAAL